MKNLDLNAMGVTELNQQEMLNTEGGGWIADAFYAIGEAIAAAWDWLVDHATGSGIAISI